MQKKRVKKQHLVFRMIGRSSLYLESFSHGFAKWAGSGSAFMTAAISLLLWLLAGYRLDFSNQWQNALTLYLGVITFLMIFLVQRSQNKELAAIHVKLNEIIAATKGADNQMMVVEELTEKEIKEVQEIHREIVAQDVITGTTS